MPRHLSAAADYDTADLASGANVPRTNSRTLRTLALSGSYTYLVDEGAEIQPRGGGVAHDHLLEGGQQKVLVLHRLLEGVQDAGKVPFVCRRCGRSRIQWFHTKKRGGHE